RAPEPRRLEHRRPALERQRDLRLAPGDGDDVARGRSVARLFDGDLVLAGRDREHVRGALVGIDAVAEDDLRVRRRDLDDGAGGLPVAGVLEELLRAGPDGRRDRRLARGELADRLAE